MHHCRWDVFRHQCINKDIQVYNPKSRNTQVETSNKKATHSKRENNSKSIVHQQQDPREVPLHGKQSCPIAVQAAMEVRTQRTNK